MPAPFAMPRRADVSAGILAYRWTGRWEVLLVHPGGPYWAKRDDGAWSIPKGLVENADLIDTARREFFEETGFHAEGDLRPLSPVRQNSGKRVHAFALHADFDLRRFHSNAFEMEWPPKSGAFKRFPEADRAAYFAFEEALTKIIAYQQPFLHELRSSLEQSEARGTSQAES